MWGESSVVFSCCQLLSLCNDPAEDVTDMTLTTLLVTTDQWPMTIEKVDLDLDLYAMLYGNDTDWLTDWPLHDCIDNDRYGVSSMVRCLLQCGSRCVHKHPWFSKMWVLMSHTHYRHRLMVTTSSLQTYRHRLIWIYFRTICNRRGYVYVFTPCYISPKTYRLLGQGEH